MSALYERSQGKADYSRWKAKPDQASSFLAVHKPETPVAKLIADRYPFYLNPLESRRISTEQMPSNGQDWWFADAVRIGTILPIDPRTTDFEEIGAVVRKVRGDALSLIHQGGNLRAGLTILARGEGKPTIYRGQMGTGSNKEVTAFFSRDDKFPNPKNSVNTATLILVHTIARGEAQARTALGRFSDMGYEERDLSGKLKRR